MKENTSKHSPSISIIIPVLNESMRISTCLANIYQQDYPKDKIEVILVDADSTDDTLIKARRFPVKIIKNDRTDAEIGKMVGLRNAKNNLFLYLDADIELVGMQWLKKIIRPLVDNPQVVAAFPRFLPKKSDYAIGRFLRYHPLELDPLLQFFCTEIKDTVVSEENNYKICEFHYPRIPPIGICVYRKDPLLKMMGHMQKFMDVDVPVILSKNGLSRFAYVPECGIYHTNVKSIRDLVKKRLRNIDKVFVPNYQQRQFHYLNLRSRYSNLWKVFWWAVYANLFFPALIKGMIKALRYKDPALIYEPFVTLIVTDAVIFGFLKNKEARRIISEAI